MCEGGVLEAQRVVDEQLLGRVDDVVLAADDRVDVHAVVVDDHRVVVGGHAVALEDDDVLDGAVLVDGGVFAVHFDMAVDHVVEDQFLAGRDFEEDGAVLLVGLALVEQLLSVFLIEVHALRLPVGAEVAALVRALVPLKPHPAQAVHDGLFVLLGRAFEVRILDAQHKGAARMSGPEPVEERRMRAAYVQRACGAGCESRANFFIVHVFLYLQRCNSFIMVIRRIIIP